MGEAELNAVTRERLLMRAREAADKAYAPYSGIRVGAAALTRAGGIYTGANVENASSGLTVCAERAAVFAAVAQEGPEMRLRALAVVNDAGTAFPPCGACRQVIYEFGPEAAVIFQGPHGLEEVRADALLPAAFRLPVPK